jgi:signal transduction histidine kinase
MRRPWQIWLLFGLGLAVVVPAMVWLTLGALELDREQSVARKQAELEEDISRALWRMDVFLTPLLAEEAARPDFFYQPVYETAGGEMKGGGKAASSQELSPLLKSLPEYVLVHFEVQPDGSLTSPQNPVGNDNTWALSNGASLATINTAADRLAILRPALDRDWLLAQLPAQPLAMATRFDPDRPPPAGQVPSPQVIASNYDFGRQLVPQPQAAPPGSSAYLFNAPPQPPAPPGASQPAPEDEQNDVPNQAVGQQREVNQEAAQQQLTYSNPAEVGRSQRAQSRAGNDLPNRASALQAYAQRSFNEQRSNFRALEPAVRVVEGVSRALWLGERLVLARRVQIGDQTVIQGCWLDWPVLEERLKAQVADLLPQVELMPITAAEPIKNSRLLAAIPVQISAPPVVLEAGAWSPIRASLLVAWSCLLLTAVAGAIMLQSVITLSERRGAFVSAVTHELRTPLTTFRMYAEMLAEGMVPEAAQRQKYLNTLRIEADRLSHLVENVLQYARLERSRSGRRREPVTLAALLDHCQSRLAERAEQAEMKLVVECQDGDRATAVVTDLSAVEQILFNLVDNACKYAAAAADKRLHLQIAVSPRRVTITVLDHGPGIAAAGRRRLFQPFSKSVHEAANSAPGVGLGLALCRRLASDLGGKLELQSPADGGAAFVLTLPR